MRKKKVVIESQSDYQGQESHQRTKSKGKRRVGSSQGSNGPKYVCKKCGKKVKSEDTLYNHVHGPIHKTLSQQEKRQLTNYKKVQKKGDQMRRTAIKPHIHKTTVQLQVTASQLRLILKQLLNKSHQFSKFALNKKRKLQIQYSNQPQIRAQLQRLKQTFAIQKINQILQHQAYLRHKEDKGFRQFICIDQAVEGLTVQDAAKIQLELEIIAALQINDQHQIAQKLSNCSTQLWRGLEVIPALLQLYYDKCKEAINQRESHLQELSQSSDESSYNQMMELAQ